MGALTSKPYAFSARPWELSDVFAVDYFDTLHAPLRLSTRGSELLRILPDLRYSSLNEWISDRSRFSYDAIACNRASSFSFFFRGCGVSRLVSKSYLSRFFFSRFFLSSNISFDFFGLEQSLFKSRILARAGLLLTDPVVDTRPPVANFSEVSASIFVVGLSVRYTHPVVQAYLKQLKKSGRLLIDLGDSAISADYSLGSSLKNFFTFFRFKIRLSLLAASGFFLTSSRIFHAFPFLFGPANSLVLPESPAFGTFSELGIKSLFNFPNRSSKLSFSFSSYASATYDFLIASPHPYETKFVSHVSLPAARVYSDQSLPAVNFFYDFFSGFFDEVFALGQSRPVSSYHESSDNCFVFSSPSFRHFNVYSAYTYYDHFAGYSVLRNSTNILLNIRRNEDYRHTHFCSF